MRDYEARASLTEEENALLDAILHFDGITRRTDAIRRLIREGAALRGLLPGERLVLENVENELREAFANLGLSRAAIEYALRGRQ